ncbi:MAG: hypothetical protein HeimC2_21640 [Candidatus Heimdallarchaeota archaeon LC_2]|nr:MAG: hypothetical protein HeimC2_21640 [Candidatus Heimdallarchaeota archaeon LC_2]
MNVIRLLHNIQLRVVISWFSVRFLSQLFQYNMELVPLLVLTGISTFTVGLLIRDKEETGVPIEETSFTPIDARSPRIEDDILANDRHLEIVISNQGVKTNS